ncbi:MAG: DUF1801 domain-containing protein [Maritimibacter sp.]
MNDMLPEVRAAYDAAPPNLQKGLMSLRALVLEVAEATKGAHPLREDLRWGQPAFLAPKGSTLRVGLPKSGGFALYVNCQTTLMEEFRTYAGGAFRLEGNRAILFDSAEEIDREALAPLITRALTYHDKKGIS